MAKIKIIRHSERLDFTNPFYWLFYFGHYWADSPLTANGYTIANDKGKKMVNQFNPRYIYTSPYNRTMATATEIKNSFPHSEIIIEPLLAEYQPNYKHKINLYPKGIPTKYDGIETGFSYPETQDQFNRRVKFIISKLIEKNDSDIIIMTHGAVLKTYINYLQEEYPELILDPKDTPYLTVLSFEYDNVNKKIVEESIKIE
jgi:broad specificity phosphatase PhoE